MNTSLLRMCFAALMVASGASILPATSHAQATLITGLGGPAGFGTNVLPPNDDGSSATPIDLTAYNLSGLCFFGRTHTSLFINNNGNVTFNAAVGTYTPTAFPVSSNPMIAPWWADVDTRGAGAMIPPQNRVYWSVVDGLLVVTWYRVGYYNQHIAPSDTFQLAIRRVPTMTDPNNYDIEFRYQDLNWTTGDASGGAMGLGGTPAQAGFDAGDMLNFQALPGSRTSAVLNLLTTSNTMPAQPGLWVFNMRSCNLTSACTTNAQCGGNRPICDTTMHVCRPCGGDPECPAATRACVTSGPNTGACLQCTAANATACMGATPTCDVATGTCACLTNANCSGATPICDTTTRSCRACDAARAADCTGATPVCAVLGANSGRCVQCTAARPAACVAPTATCDAAANVCRACVTNTDCNGGTPICDPGTFTCRACNPSSATDCTGATPTCETAGARSGRCVQCNAGSAATCVAPTPVCDTTSDTCVACNTNAQCSGATPICNAATHVCRACALDSECPAAGPVCVTSGTRAGACVQCTAANRGACTGTMLCNPATNQCVGCVSNGDCSGATPICDATLSVCRACNPASGADCSGVTPACATMGTFAGRCVQCEPGMTMACTGATPICSATTDTCLGCLSNSDCGGGTPICDGTSHRCRACATSDCSGIAPVCEATGTNSGRCVACDAANRGACTGMLVCDATTNTCVGCRANSDCAGSTPFCDMTTRVCRGCNATDCIGTTAVCATMGSSTGTCVQCEPGMSAACTGATMICDATTDTCVGCATSADCSGGTPICDRTAHSCRACMAADCSGTTPACVSSGTFAGHCEQCTTGATAACIGATPVCDTTTDHCVLCIPGPTGDASACATQASGHACIAAMVATDPAFCGCSADVDCGNSMSGRICDGTTHACIDGCWPGAGHNGCPTGLNCTSTSATMPGHCSSTCTQDSDCPTAHPHCLPGSGGAGAMCVDCVADTNCAARADHRDRCIGADHTCAQCTGTDVASCEPNAIGGACLGTGLCGCSADTDCSASRRCDTSMHACVMRAIPDAGTDSGTDAGGADASRADSGAADVAHRDGSTDVPTGGSVSGGGACACRTTGTGSSSRDSRNALMLIGLGVLFARRRRIAR